MNRIPVALTREQWSGVLQILSQQPWHLVDGLIREIQQQATRFEASSVQAGPEREPAFGAPTPNTLNGSAAP